MGNHDDLFDALADGHRRQLLLELLSDSQYILQLSGISQEIAEADEALLRRHLSSSRTIAEADERSVSLHHIHLPKLAEYGFIEWDQDENSVARGPRFDEIRPYLELLDESRDESRTRGPVVTLRR